jgi:hypothetical protein
MAERLPPADGSSGRRRPRVFAMGHNLTASGEYQIAVRWVFIIETWYKASIAPGLLPPGSRMRYLSTILVDKLVGILLPEDRPPSKSNILVTLPIF